MEIEKLEELNKNLNSHIYDVTNESSKLNEFAGFTFNFDYKNVMHFFKNIENKNYDNACFSIGLTEKMLNEKGVDFLEKIYNYLNSERFLSPTSKNDIEFKIQALKKHRRIKTQEEEEDYRRRQAENKDKIFCHFGDYDLINSLFLEKYSIDLEKDNINYFFYTFKLNAILEEESNCLVNRIKARNFKPTPGKENKKNNEIGLKMKNKYKL